MLCDYGDLQRRDDRQHKRSHMIYEYLGPIMLTVSLFIQRIIALCINRDLPHPSFKTEYT